MKTLIVCAVFLFSLTGCFVEGIGQGEETNLSLELVVPVSKVSLETTPLFVMACISAEDLAEPVCETYNGEVYSESEESYEGSLVLKVVSGERRTLSVTLFYATAQGVLSYDYYYPALTLDPGDQTLTAQLNLTPTFTLEAIISGESLLPTALVPVDILTGVTFPAVDLSVDAFGNSVITIEHLPQGRFFYLVPVGETTPYRFCPIYSGQGGVLQKTINIDDESC